MKELLIAEMKRAIELFEKIEEGKKQYEIEKEELENKKKLNPNAYYGYVFDKTFKDQAELKKMLKMVRLHSIEFEKQEKSRFNR